jgi:putative ABC transport system permease protein
MRQGATAETNSILTETNVREIAALPGIATDARGVPLVSAETLVILHTPRRDTGGKAHVMLRGVTPMAGALRSNFRIVKGRSFEPGLREVITGEAMAKRFLGANLDEELLIHKVPYRVVGLFTAGGSAAESEVWADLDTMAQTTHREGYHSAVQLRAAGLQGAALLRERLEQDERFGLKAVFEPEYFREQASSGSAIKVVGTIISTFLILGSCFAVANTMYGAVSARAREIGTLRALGFSRFDVLQAFLLEAILLCIAGGVLGCLLTLPLHGISTGTANWVTFSEITFAFRFGPRVLLTAFGLALLMGIIGGLLPALRATRMRIVDALRDA